MKQLLLFFIKHSKILNILSFFIVIVGLWVAFSLPRQHMPTVKFDILDIRTIYPGRSPEDIETQITDVIEDELEALSSIEKMVSLSFEGVSHTVVKIDPDLESSKKDQLKREIRDKIANISDFPKDLDHLPVIHERNSSDQISIEVFFSGKKVSEDNLRTAAKNFETILRQNCEAVGDIALLGYREKELHVLLDINSMKQYKVAFSDIVKALRASHFKSSAGFLESSSSEKQISTDFELEKALDIQNCVVRNNFLGKKISVKDIAICKEAFEDRESQCFLNGENGINVVLTCKGDFDLIDMTDSVRKNLKNYRKILQKTQPDIKAELLVDYSEYTKSLLAVTKRNALWGLCILFICLCLFLDFKIVFWLCFGLFISVVGSFIFFNYFDLTLNHVVLLSIIILLGLLVDDAIIVAENIFRHKEESNLNIKDACVLGITEVFQPVMGTILTTISCYIPMYFMSGIMGKFIFSIPTVVITMLLFSFFECFTLFPCHLAHIKTSLRKPIGQKFLNFFRSYYDLALRWCLRHGIFVFSFFLSFLILIYIFSIKNNRFVLFPDDNPDIFYISLKVEKGSSLEETHRSVETLFPYLEKIPKDCLKNFKVEVGHHRTLDFESSVENHKNWAIVTVFLYPANIRPMRSEEIVKIFKEKLEPIRKNFSFLEIKKIHKGPPIGQPVDIHLISDNFDLCEEYEKKIVKTLGSVEGVFAIDSSNFGGQETLDVILDREKMSRYDVSPPSVSLALRVAYHGVSPLSMRVGGDKIDFRIRLNDKDRKDPAVLKKIFVKNRKGRLILLKDLASFKTKQSNQIIRHYSGQKSIRITAKLNTEKVTSMEVNNLIRRKHARFIESDPNIRMILGGEEKETEKSVGNFFKALWIALILIYCILLIVVDSYLQPFLIMSVLPFAMGIIFMVFYFHQLPLSFMGIIGSLAMLGVTINDSLVMVSYLNRIFAGSRRRDDALIVQGAGTRFRPIMLTTLTTVVALFPTIYGLGGQNSFLIPMLLPMSWGLLFSTFVTLFLIPILYSFSLKSPDLRKETHPLDMGF